MQGLQDSEWRGCREILESMLTADLMSLKDTVTGGLIVVESREEAINTILCYSQSALELLKRRKVSRDIIFSYLAKQGVVFPPSSEKSALVQIALEYWKESKVAVEKVNPKGIDYETLGEHFCRWFYQLWNSQNPTLNMEQETWGPQHFWEDTKLNFLYYTSVQNCEEFLGSEISSHRLLSLVKDEHLFFNPNMDGGGLKCACSPYGLVVVAVAGTIHRGTVCLGVFEQIFGLIRAPLEGSNWKIKFVNLNIKGQNVLEQVNSSLKPVVKYNKKELEGFYNGM
ncbi:uncharacterized protein C3orf38 homolog [Protopterus annectens]|uniref:uncharacterized protein C3orf38 homolog n=1 Tax=Protopterus annectens TaxID=7888 RepID=UPI001CFB01A7|nr:uncharacterized protein C3orf38 homolog [Protopterus annectens]